MDELDKLNYGDYHGFFNLSKTCRACLSVQEHIQNIPGDVYSYCTSVKVGASDGLPAGLCPTCYELLNRLYYFKQQCVRSDALLRHHLKPTLPQPQFVKDKDKDNGVKSEFNDVESRSTESRNCDKDVVHAEDGGQICTNPDDCLDNRCISNNSKEEQDSGPNKSENDNDEDDETQQKIDRLKRKYKKSCKRPSTMLYCQKCDKSFYKYVKLEAHMRKHFGMKPDSAINCNQCDKKFTTERNLKSHLRVHTGERKYKCKTCGKAFAYLNVLKNHERAHAGIKKYICHQCGKKFVQLTNLNTHLLQHSGEKPYVCEVCNRRFGQPSQYKLHLLRHTGVKNFPCNLCPLRFYTNANLKKHMGVHSEVRPYACKICDKRFKTHSYMAVHNRTHTGERPFCCDYCTMKFMSGKDKRNHHKTHTGEKTNPGNRLRKPRGQQTQLHDLDIPSDTNVSQHPYPNQLEMHNTLSPAGVVVNKSTCSYDSIHKSDIDKQNSNIFLLPPPIKAQCSFSDPMY